MFTGNTCSLNPFSGSFGLLTQRSCNFSCVGKVPTRLEGRIVPCNKPEHIESAIASAGVVGIITFPDFAASVPEPLGLAISDNPLRSALLLQDYLASLPDFQWNSFDSRIHSSVTVYPGAYIAKKDVVIGEGSIIYPNAAILPRSIIGSHCSIGPGTIVSADAFEVNTAVSPQSIVKQSGGVRLASYVDVQAKCTLVRSTFGGFTELGEETKLDCQVHVAHDCLIGKRVRIAACAEISGRVEIGDDTFIGPNASISSGVQIGAYAQVTIGSVVTRDVPDGVTVSGNFAIEHEKWLTFMRSVR